MNMRYFSQILIALLMVSCNTVRVNYDYDRETNFSNYSTYNYYPDMETGLSALDTKRLIGVLDMEMRLKGMLLSEEPDFFINVTSNISQTARSNSVGVGLGGGGRNVGGGVSIGIPVGRPKLECQIQFDFVDSQKDMLFWQGLGKGPFKENTTPEARELRLREIVQKVFAKYPPN